MARALRFKQFQSPGRQPGERARIKVVQGPDYGSLFVVTDARATVGRGEDNDLVILDLKASRHHAEFVWSPSGWGVRDLGSANGIIHNGHLTRQAQLRTGDTVSIGETVLEFADAQSGTQALVSPPKSMAQVIQERKAPAPGAARAMAPAAAGAARGGAKGKGSDGGRRIVLGIALAVIVVFAIDPEKRKLVVRPRPIDAPAVVPPVPDRTPDSVTPPTEAEVDQARQAAEGFMRAGIREYRERNFLRAKQNFSNVLQINPRHPSAERYLQNCDRAINEEVRRHLDAGKKSLAAGRLRDARGHFEAVLRLRRLDPTDSAAVESLERIEEIKKKLERREAG